MEEKKDSTEETRQVKNSQNRQEHTRATTSYRNGEKRPKMLINALYKIEKSIQKAEENCQKLSQRPTHDTKEIEHLEKQVNGIMAQVRIIRQSFTSSEYPSRSVTSMGRNTGEGIE